MDILQGILYGILTFFTQLIEAVTGFGSSVLALPFAIAITGSVIIARSPTTLHTWMYAGWVVTTDFKKILWRQYFTIMLFVILGFPVGMLASHYLPDKMLRIVLAVFMVAVSINGIIRGIRNKESSETSHVLQYGGWKMSVFYVLLFLGGVIHGAFSTGGPLLIIYTTIFIREKGNFRATMCAIWFTLNTLILIEWFFTGVFEIPGLVWISLITIPFFVVGAYVGNLIHNRISAKHFTQLVYIILLVSGCFMGYSTLLG